MKRPACARPTADEKVPSTAPCGDVAPPVIDGTWGCLLRRPLEEDRGHRQARVRLSKAAWANIIATRYRRLVLACLQGFEASGDFLPDLATEMALQAFLASWSWQATDVKDHRWQSRNVFRTYTIGTVDLSRDAPVSGSYEPVDPAPPI